MRALLLLVLGAGLVWFVWRGLGPGSPAEADVHASAPGSMISVEGTDEAGREPPPPSEPKSPDVQAVAPSSAPAAEPVAVAEPSAAAVRQAPVEPTPPSSTTPATAPAPGESFHATELVAAEEFLRDQAGFSAWLATRGVDLPPGRRELAIGLAHAFARQDAEALAALDRADRAGGVEPAERELIRRIARRETIAAEIIPAAPLARAAAIREAERVGHEHLAQGRSREAAETFSRLILAELDAPWPAAPDRLRAWTTALHDAQRGHRWNRRGSWRSTDVVVQPGDSLIGIRKRVVASDPNLVVCTGQIARANQLEGEVIHPGAKLRIPAEPVSMLVDLDAHWALYMAGAEVIAAWPVGVGKEGSATQVGTFTVGEKLKEPMWFPQGRKPIPYGDPENPLGTRWIKWIDSEGGTTHLGFHGTNEPASIGSDASQGCIRMHTPDVEELFEILPVGAKIHVRP